MWARCFIIEKMLLGQVAYDDDDEGDGEHDGNDGEHEGGDDGQDGPDVMVNRQYQCGQDVPS